MRKLMALVAALGAAPIVALAAIQSTAPAFADTPSQGPACVSQSLNPHPTDPAGQTTNTLFCTNPNGSGSGGGAGKTGTGTGTTAGAGTTAGGGQTSLAGSSGTGSTPDESGHGLNGTSSSGSGKPAASTGTGLFGGLVGFFASAGGMVFLFGLLMLMLIVLIALGVIAALRRGGKNFASRFSRVSYRA
jgi:hypothetical protein